MSCSLAVAGCPHVEGGKTLVAFSSTRSSKEERNEERRGSEVGGIVNR